METKKYLNEERYQKSKTLLIVIAAIVLVIGTSIGGILLANGIQRLTNNYKQDELTVEQATLLAEKTKLEAEGIKYDPSAPYTAGKTYDLKVIVNTLNPSRSSCNFNESQTHVLTAKYCKIKNSNGHAGIPFIMIGVFVIIASLMISGAIFMTAKGREVAAFHAQQMMPVAKESIEEMTPTMAKAGATIAKEMAPVYGEMAKEITKGIKEGIKDDTTDK